jgi:hypothetical protein
VSVSQACPVALATTQGLSFRVGARTVRTGLQWRRAPANSDVLSPPSGEISSNGNTTVDVLDLALDSGVTIEVVDGTAVLLRFTLRHQ